MPLPAPDLRCAGRTKPHSLTPPSRTPLRPAAAYVSSGEFSSPSTSPSRASADGYAASGTIIGIQDGTLAKIPLLLTPETSPRRKEPGSRAHARALRRARDGCAMPPRRAAPTRGLAARAASIDLTSRATPCTQRLDTADALNLAPVAGLAGRAFPGGGGVGAGGSICMLPVRDTPGDRDCCACASLRTWAIVSGATLVLPFMHVQCPLVAAAGSYDPGAAVRCFQRI